MRNALRAASASFTSHLSAEDYLESLRGSPIYISNLSLLNFRNYEMLDLDLAPGTVLIQGGNAQGKSNLVEAAYMLAIAKSPRASSDRELVRRQAPPGDNRAQVSAAVQREGGAVRLQIDFLVIPAATLEADGVVGQSQQSQPGGIEAASVQKQLRVNGVQHRTSEMVGEINAVMFGAQDLELVLGSPVVRRRYLDILISQIDPRYLKALQRYQRVVSQRNHLLKTVREGDAQPSELDFWDEELTGTGAYIVSRRLVTVAALSQAARAIYQELVDAAEGLDLVFRPSVDVAFGASEDEIQRALKESLDLQRLRELAQGFTVSGPHRDDFQMLLADMDAGVYGSRGQCRTVVLAMKLAEASYLQEQRGQEPILLLDDVLSELDRTRRARVLRRASQYQQCLITTADVEQIEERYLSEMSRFVVDNGQVMPIR